MKYIFLLVSGTISIVIILFSAYAIFFIFQGLLNRNFRFRSIVVPCLHYFFWLAALLLSCLLMAVVFLFLGDYVLKVFSVSKISIMWTTWMVGIFLMSVLVAAGTAAFFWKTFDSRFGRR